MSNLVLTAGERETLNSAAAILKNHTPDGAQWMPYFLSGWDSLTYFTSAKTQHSSIGGATFADKVQRAIELEDAEARDADGTKARRVARLREQLAELTGEAA